jgi:hypothetical protein
MRFSHSAKALRVGVDSPNGGEKMLTNGDAKIKALLMK